MLVKLKNVRLNFGHLFEASVSPKFPNNDPKYGGTFLMDKSTKHGKDAVKLLAKVRDEVLGENVVKADKMLITDGDEPGQHEANAGLFIVKAANKNRPVVVDAEGNGSVAADGLFYDGCYVNVALDVYYYADMKGVFATLLGVQFASDGDTLGVRRYTADEMFGNEG
tara:strand:- start:6985 stop:7485 length:501 start_codon:yes stop_codon:yes gene_type:complete